MIPVAFIIIVHCFGILNPQRENFYKKGDWAVPIAGIICEYNPFHLGHRKQMQLIRSALGENTAIVCLMSGNFVQRGAPAIFDKSLRANAALLSGADLVLDMPVPVSLSSAEGFAVGGVRILSELCTHLAFGCETATESSLQETVRGLLHPDFSPLLRKELESGISFPAAREQVLRQIGISATLLHSPNDTLAVEYCKAIFMQHSPLLPLPILRGGAYHAEVPDAENPSAVSLRQRILAQKDWERYVPDTAAELFRHAAIHDLRFGERAILYRLRTMTDAEFEAVPYGSEGLWRRFMRECRIGNSVDDILARVKTKRYTRTRLDRMLLCAYLGITEEILTAPVPYVRILGFSQKGREILHNAQSSLPLLNAGAPAEGVYARQEALWGDLYGLFQAVQPDMPLSEKERRVILV